MASSNLEDVRECPHDPKTYYVVYDGGTTPDLPVLLCQSCFDKPLFQKFIKQKEYISEKQNFENLSSGVMT